MKRNKHTKTINKTHTHKKKNHQVELDAGFKTLRNQYISRKKKKRKNKRKKGQPDTPTWTKKIIMPIPFLFYCHHFSARSEDSKTAIPKRRTEEK